MGNCNSSKKDSDRASSTSATASTSHAEHTPEELRVYFVRHGRSTWNKATEHGIIGRLKEFARRDAPLDSAGIQQALYAGMRSCYGSSDEDGGLALQERMNAAILDKKTLFVSSNLHRAIDTMLLFLAPFVIDFPEAFPEPGGQDEEFPHGRQIKVMSLLQEISAGSDAKPDAQHGSPRSENREHQEYDTMVKQMDTEFDHLIANASDESAMIAAGWRTVKQLVVKAYGKHSIDGSMNRGDASVCDVELFNLESSIMPVHLHCHLPTGRGQRLNQMQNELCEELFSLAAEGKTQTMVMFGHSLWFQHFIQTLGTPETANYQHCKIDHCGIVEITIRKAPTVAGYEVCTASPDDRPGLRGWTKKTLKEDLLRTEKEFAEELRKFIDSWNERLGKNE